MWCIRREASIVVRLTDHQFVVAAVVLLYSHLMGFPPQDSENEDDDEEGEEEEEGEVEGAEGAPLSKPSRDGSEASKVRCPTWPVVYALCGRRFVDVHSRSSLCHLCS